MGASQNELRMLIQKPANGARRGPARRSTTASPRAATQKDLGCLQVSVVPALASPLASTGVPGRCRSTAPHAPSWTASSSGTNSGWTSPSRPCVWRGNESVCRTVNYCTTPGCCVSKNPCHRTCRRSNDREGEAKHRRLRPCKTPRHVEVEWRAVSTGPSAVRHGAIPLSHLKVEACAKCHSQRRASLYRHAYSGCRFAALFSGTDRRSVLSPNTDTEPM